MQQEIDVFTFKMYQKQFTHELYDHLHANLLAKQTDHNHIAD